eukprot:TRINITY_DN1051_c0_g1_i1.p1 TRINITY_DN1051_c0_g1~~TRINITY_DN1051_c0_g1_i1.p1  ORF type:complete len:154 (+),score=22.37 TRINITY_DN1051_c0_g1_i1:488-949(+)
MVWSAIQAGNVLPRALLNTVSDGGTPSPPPPFTNVITIIKSAFETCTSFDGGYTYTCSDDSQWWAYILIAIAFSLVASALIFMVIRKWKYRQALMEQGIIPPNYTVEEGSAPPASNMMQNFAPLFVPQTGPPVPVQPTVPPTETSVETNPRPV